ncbi:MAG TPA: O-methyltransferase [Candidatus Dormibacteraeota bacterium]
MPSQPEQWNAVDEYFADVFVGSDRALEAALRASEAAGLPAIQVTPNQGKLLHLFARMIGARNVLEVGTLGGYSTIWLARALPEDGRVITLEIDAKHAAVARANFERAGVAGKIDLKLGAALDILPSLQGPFDLAFIDADKQNNPDYFNWALKLSRPGGVIIIDNVVRDGSVLEAGSNDPTIVGVRKVNEMTGSEQRVSATAIQMVGAKGWDGFSLALVVS